MMSITCGNMLETSEIIVNHLFYGPNIFSKMNI